MLGVEEHSVYLYRAADLLRRHKGEEGSHDVHHLFLYSRDGSEEFPHFLHVNLHGGGPRNR